jgi:hypothetical protein
MTDLTDFVNVMASAEDWLAASASNRETAAPSDEPMKRFTIDVPVSLHRRNYSRRVGWSRAGCLGGG